MNKRYKIIIYAAVILMLISAAYNYFNVKGNKIKGVSEISPECSVSIAKSYHLVEGEQNYTLDSEQIGRLKSLISNSSFTRVLSSTVHFYDKDIYTIKIDFNNSQDFLTIHCTGNEFISIADQFNGKYLKIKDPEWKNKLEEIISLQNN